MSGHPPDRRVRRTRRRLKEALLELMDERGYEALTVVEIAERADVGRSTFYAHFESKEDLLFAGVQEHLAAMARRGDAPDAPSAAGGPPAFRFSLPLLLHVRLQRRFFQEAVLGGADPRLREISEGILAEVVAEELGRMAPAPDSAGSGHGAATATEVRRGRARAVVGAFMGLLDWWLRHADHLPAEAVEEIFQRCAGPLAEADATPAEGGGPPPSPGPAPDGSRGQPAS